MSHMSAAASSTYGHASPRDEFAATRPHHLSVVDTEAADSPLSPRETEVLALIQRGLSNLEITHELYLSLNTVKSHIRSAYRKMGVTTRAQAVIWCFTHPL